MQLHIQMVAENLFVFWICLCQKRLKSRGSVRSNLCKCRLNNFRYCGQNIHLVINLRAVLAIYIRSDSQNACIFLMQIRKSKADITVKGKYNV